MLSSTDKNKLVDKINTAFANIGKSNGTKMPRSEDNREPIAWELFIAQHVNALASKRKDAAEKAAMRADIITDKEKHPKPEGSKSVEYTGENVQIMLSVSTAATRVDVNKLIDYLVNKGVDAALVQAAHDHASAKTRPAHVFSSVLLTE